MKNLRAGTTLAVLLAAGGLTAGCTQDFLEATPLGEALGYEHHRVTARKALMASHPRNIRAITAALKENKLADAAKAAQDISTAARRIPLAFRRQTLAGKTTALPAIWQKKADFDQKAIGLATSAAALAVVLRAGDKAGAEGALKTMQGNCGACHRLYRKPPPPRPAAPRG